MPTKNGVEFYAKGNLTEPVFFPNGVLCCNSCWLKKSKTTNKHLAKELRKLGYAVDIYSESTNKFVKISTYLRSAWKDIFWLESTDPEYINEILDYSEFAEHDDSPDSAASLLRKLEQRTTYNPIKGGI